MAFYRRRRNTYRRRKDPRRLLKAIAVLLVIAVCAAVVVQTTRLQKANEIIAKYEKGGSLAAPDNTEDSASPPADDNTPPLDSALPYQKLYPDMKADSPQQFAAGDPKAVYLTFDDGPSSRTATILDALAAKSQKATFFVVGKNIAGNEALVKRIVDEGHTLGIHGFSHDYAATYASVDAFLEDFHQAYEAVYAAAGVYPTLFRFPGGSVNAYNRATYQPIIAEMIRRGFVYHDWNIATEDASGKAYRASQLIQTVTSAVTQNERAVVMLHDAADKKVTADAIPKLLDALYGLGYYADRLNPDTLPITFAYND